MWHDGGIGWGGWVVMTVMMLVFWALLIFGGIALWQAMRRDTTRPAERPPADERSDALRLLDERFARGEVDVDDYQHRRELLRAGR